MFADDIEERTKIELKEHIIYNSRAIYDLNPSAATDTEIIGTKSMCLMNISQVLWRREPLKNNK